MRGFFDDRHGSPAAVLTLAGIICLLIASIGLNWKQQRDLAAIKQVLVSRCEARQASDARTRDDLQGRIDLYSAIVAAETVNEFISDEFRARRIAPYRTAMTAAEAALAALPKPADCAAVYASEDGPAALLR